MKKAIFSAALLMAAATISFAGNPKGDTRDAKTTAIPGEAKTEMEATYYWFPTDATGTSYSDPSGIPLSQNQSSTGPCNGSNTPICAKGLTLAETTISGGKRVATVAASSVTVEDHRQ